jgi:hypothetical protein
MSDLANELLAVRDAVREASLSDIENVAVALTFMSIHAHEHGYELVSRIQFGEALVPNGLIEQYMSAVDVSEFLTRLDNPQPTH